MNEPVLCIDFGSAYTKVAIRRDPNEASELIRSEALRLDELRVCVPSIVLLDQRSKQPVWECGMKAVDRAAGPGIQIFRNFKPHLFRESPPEPASEIEQFLGSPEIRGLASARGLDTALLGVLELLRGRAQAPRAESGSLLLAEQDPVDEAAREFFRALLSSTDAF